KMFWIFSILKIRQLNIFKIENIGGSLRSLNSHCSQRHHSFQIVSSFLINRDHRLVDQITDSPRHILFALALLPPPAAKFFLFGCNLLFERMNLSSFLREPALSFLRDGLR